MVKELKEVQAALRDQRTVAVSRKDTERDGVAMAVTHLCDEEEAEEEADCTEAQEQQFPPITLPEHRGKHVGH